MQRKTIIICLLMLPLLSAMAQGPNNSGTYYQNADGKKGAALKTALCGIIYNRTERSYSDLWTDFQKTDKRSDGKVWDMYSNSSNFVFGTHQDRGSGGKNEGEYYNREHSWPNSWFGGNVQPMYTDLHHIYPTDKFVNSKRSNYPLGETNGERYKSNNGFSKVGSCTYSGYTGTVFEPNDEYKGDFARTYFYMVTCYEEKLPDWYNNYSESQSTLDGSTYPGLSSWQLEMLMKWAKNDPVSEKEISRNNAVYDLQNNRNPFIDYPGLEEYIWGGKQNFAFSYDDDNSGVEVNSTNFPDEAFRNWVLQNVSGASDGILTDEEISKVTSIDCSGTSSNKGNISSLQGIEFFTALTNLDCSSNQLTGLDMSECTALTRLSCGWNLLTSLNVSKNTALTYLHCTSNQLTTLDVSKNTKLTSLSCGSNQLTSLDVSLNTTLTYLDCPVNQLPTLDVSNNTALTRFLCFGNQLTTLDVSNNTALTELWASSNQLKSLDLSKNTALAYLTCDRNQLTSLDVSKNTALTTLSCYSNQLTSLDVSKNTALTTLSCYSNQLTSLDLSNNNSINSTSTNISSQTRSLTAVDVSTGIAIPVPSDFEISKVTNLKLNGTAASGSITSGNGQKYLVFAPKETAQSSINGKNLTYTYSTGNNFSQAASMDVTVTLSYTPTTPPGIEVNATNFPDEAFRNWVLQNVSGASDGILTDEEIAKVKSIDVSSNSGISLQPDGSYKPDNPGNILNLQGVEFFTGLTYIDCSCNQLESLDVSKNTSLVNLDCSGNQLTSLDVNKNTALRILDCNYNQITSLDVRNNTTLTSLSCGSNLLTTLDVSKNTALTQLWCYTNLLTTLDVSKNTALTQLWCYTNQLTSLDVSKNTALTQLWCYANQLTSLDVSNNTALTWLWASSNQLTSLDVSNNTALELLDCSSIQLTSLDVSKNTALAYLTCDRNQLTSLDVSKNTALTQLTCYSNQLTSLDVNQNTKLTFLWCSSNQLTTLDVSKNTALTRLDCSSNQLTALDVSKNMALTRLDCSSNQLTTLDVSKNTALTRLRCGSNQLTSLDLSNNNSINDSYTYIESQYRLLTAVDVSVGIAIPVSSDFEISKVSNLKLSGTAVSGSITSVNGQKYLVFAPKETAQSAINGKKLTYTYSTGNSFSQAASMDVTVTLSYSPTTYSLSIQSGAGGSVSYNGTTITNKTQSFTVNEGTSATITISPNTGYKLSKLTVNGTNVTSSVKDNKYTISSVSGNTTVVATFEQVTYTLSVQATGNGTVTYNSTATKNKTNSFSVNHGSSATLSISPDSGYRLASLKVNGTNVTSSVSNNQYTVSSITANTTIVATFEQIPATTYSLSIQSGAGGSVSYDGTTITNKTQSFTVNEGTSATITITPNNGYRLSRLTVNGTNVTSSVKDNQYTISSISGNTTIVATFEQIPATTYSLSIQSRSGGSVTYNGTTVKNATQTFTVNEGVSVTITMTQDNGYRLASLTVNGTNVTSSVKDNQYTISNITTNTTVVATFEEIPATTFSLSIQSGAGGSVAYNGTTITNKTQSFTVAEGTSATITISPNTGYKLSRLTVNGTDVTSNVKDNQYTISSITGNTTVVATFEQITYTLSVQASGNGTVTYNSTGTKNTTHSFTVNHGSSSTLSIAPDNGYRLASLTVNGTNVTSSVSNNQYTISNITANTTVVATFEQIPATTYSLSIQSGAGGSVSFNGTTVTNTTRQFTVEEGTSVTITISPNSGYRLSSLTVNGTNVTSDVKDNQYTISNITGNTNVVVTFKVIPQSITQDCINYVLASAADYTLNVGRGDYSGHVIVPATINYDGDTWTVAGVEDGAFNLSAITAITWNPNTAIGNGAFGTQSNPNLLLYVKTEAYAPSNVQNVIANGRAKKIILTEAASGNDFNCPESFTAEEISYTHKYGMTTGINECRGWETIALPFTVQKVTHQTKGQLVTFKQWDQSDSAKPYWLYKLTYTGFVEADFIEANTPYVISMPNNDTYYADFILAGTVTFSAENATVKSSENLVTTSCNDKTFKPCFAKSSQNGIYAINAVNDWTTAVGGFKEGSVFVENLRPVMPFEAYMTTSAANAKGFIPIFETLPTAIRDIPTQGMGSTKGVRIYTLSGQLVISDEDITIDEALKRLKRGVYFVNGKKMVIRKEAF